jgi:acylphosphatase
VAITGEVGDLAVRDRVRALARGLGLLGWVRLMEDGTLCVHAERDPAALNRLLVLLRELGSVVERDVRVEGLLHAGGCSSNAASVMPLARPRFVWWERRRARPSTTLRTAARRGIGARARSDARRRPRHEAIWIAVESGLKSPFVGRLRHEHARNVPLSPPADRSVVPERLHFGGELRSLRAGSVRGHW